MGLLEIHFHDSEFVFRPSMRIGPSASEADSDGEETETDWTTTTDAGDTLRFPLDEPEGSRKGGLLVALILLGALLLLRRVLQNRGRP
jgi:MYXO-CTERM domain-containing protein